MDRKLTDSNDQILFIFFFFLSPGFSVQERELLIVGVYLWALPISDFCTASLSWINLPQILLLCFKIRTYRRTMSSTFSSARERFGRSSANLSSGGVRAAKIACSLSALRERLSGLESLICLQAFRALRAHSLSSL